MSFILVSFGLALGMTFNLYSLPHMPVAFQNEEILNRSTEIQSLRMQAQKLFDDQELDKALRLYEQITQKDKRGCEDLWNDSILDQARCEASLGLYEKALLTLHQVDQNNLKKMQRFNHQLLLSKIHLEKKEIPQALEELLSLLQAYPLSEWPLDERPYLLHARSCSLQYYQKLMGQAKRLIQTNQFEEAYETQNRVLEGVEKGIYQFKDPQSELYFTLEVAQCEYELDMAQRAIQRLVEVKGYESDLFQKKCLHLLIQAYQSEGEIDKALKCCSEYLSTGPFEDASEKSFIELQEATLLLLKGEEKKAKEIFVLLSQKEDNKTVASSAKIYLSQIALHAGKTQEAFNYLREENFDCESNSSLYREWAFSLAELYFYQNNFELASQYYQKGMINHLEEKKSWWPIALYHSAYSSYQCAIKASAGDTKIKPQLKSAELHLEELVKESSNEEATELLAYVYRAEMDFLKDSIAGKKLQELFETTSFINENSYLKMAFIALSSYQKTKKRLELLDKMISECSDPAWKQKLIQEKVKNLLQQQTLKEVSHQDILDATLELWDNPQQLSFEDFESLLDSTLEVYQKRGEKEDYEKAYSFLSKLEQNYKNEPLSKEALLIFSQKATLALELISDENTEGYYLEAVQNLERALHSSLMTQEYKQQALYLLANLHFSSQNYSQAKNTFLTLYEEFSNSEFAPEALFWAAECNDIEENHPRVSKTYRKTLFEGYPQSPFADQAYFSYYRFEEYLEGKEEALTHLKQMEVRFKDSNFIILSKYLQALDSVKKYKENEGGSEKSSCLLQEALTLLGEASELFLNKRKKHTLDSKSLSYLTEVYLRSELEKGELLLSLIDSSPKKQREELIIHLKDIYEPVLSEIEQLRGARLNSMGIESFILTELNEQAQFQQAKCLIKNFQLEEGQELLKELLKAPFSNYPNVTLSKASFELGLIAFAMQDFNGALEYLEESKRRANSTLKLEELMEIGIQESLCYRALGQNDQAMLSLSKVINEGQDCNLKVKAMLLRAEIYAVQGRTELAQKQLEAAAAKGGDWAKMAQDRLVVEYGLN